MIVRRHPKFIDDLTDAYAYLAEQSPSAGDRLLDDVEALVDLLSGFAELGRARNEIRTGLRSIRVKRFAHVLFYTRSEADLILMRLLHGARDARDL